MKSLLLTGLFLASSALARPMTKNKRFSIKSEDDSTVGTSDVDILTYALVLEHLENAFYRGGLANFTAAQFAAAGFDSTVYVNLERTASDENNHVTFLTSALTALDAPVPEECTYNFPYTDPTTFLGLATVLEGVGVSVYLGAAADIASPDYLTAAGSILTVEARHASYLRGQASEPPFPGPYDTPLDFDQVYSLASPFFVSCPPTNPPLGVKAFPRLTVLNTTSGQIQPGQPITLSTTGYVVAPSPAGTTITPRQAPPPLYAAFLTPTGPMYQPAIPSPDGTTFTVQVPQTGVAGQAYVVLTACGERVDDDSTVAGPAVVEVAPPTVGV